MGFVVECVVSFHWILQLLFLCWVRLLAWGDWWRSRCLLLLKSFLLHPFPQKYQWDCISLFSLFFFGIRCFAVIFSCLFFFQFHFEWYCQTCHCSHSCVVGHVYNFWTRFPSISLCSCLFYFYYLFISLWTFLFLLWNIFSLNLIFCYGKLHKTVWKIFL